MERYYVDTNIWADYGLDRKDKHHLLGDLATVFLNKIAARNAVILYSDIVLNELKTVFTSEQVRELLQCLENTIPHFSVEMNKTRP
ncbi:hypothetical protein JXA85_01170 [Candidatus Woesearchaeota archaeon]|nr:hypothetical protein [Candidatus Woesearchaeota archaeon]